MGCTVMIAQLKRAELGGAYVGHGGHELGYIALTDHRVERYFVGLDLGPLYDLDGRAVTHWF